MTWFAASIIIGLRRHDNKGDITVYENIYLVEANSGEEALDWANEQGKLEAAIDDDGLTIDNHPAERLFGGIRKLIEITNAAGSTAEDQPRSGAEVSYSEFAVPDEETLQRLGSGESVTVQYIK